MTLHEVSPAYIAPLLWQTAKELGQAADEKVDSIVEELIVLGAISELSAKIKAGKTTFVGQLLRCMFAGEDFLGLRTQPVVVLYLTEEGPNTFRSMLVRAGLMEEERLHVLRRGIVPKTLTWPEVVATLVIPKAQEVGAKLVIVDTLSRWAGIKADEENQAGAAAMAMQPLEDLRDLNIAVLTVHHDRKSGGEVGDSSRGSSAWGGAGDVLLGLVNSNVTGHPNRRKLTSIGRFSDPGIWVIDYEQHRYNLISTSTGNVERERVKNQLLGLQSSIAMTYQQMEILTGSNRSTLERALEELQQEGLAIKSGSGVRGDPFLFSL